MANSKKTQFILFNESNDIIYTFSDLKEAEKVAEETIDNAEEDVVFIAEAVFKLKFSRGIKKEKL